MDTPERTRMPKYRWITILAAIFLLLLYAGLFAAVKLSSDMPGRKAPVPPSPPPSGGTPHILVHVPASQDFVRSDDFSSNLSQWRLFYRTGKMEQIDGALVLQSNTAGEFALAEKQDFIRTAPKYYVQADFVTEFSSVPSYGLAFGLNWNASTFYLFQITPETKLGSLWRDTAGKWDAMGTATHVDLLAYPQRNTLSVYFDDGQIQTYVNGNLVSTYVDGEPLRSAGVGAYSDGPGSRLIVDNFIAYTEK